MQAVACSIFCVEYINQINKINTDYIAPFDDAKLSALDSG